MARSGENDWVARTADQVLAEHDRRAPGKPLVCASGISPSGPIHLGNLREIMVPHLIADEIRRRGVACRHILSWDDYDRLRKVPAGLPDSFAEHIGRPLTAVPDPCEDHANWAEHFQAPFRAALADLGVEVDEVSQTQMYTSGAYQAQVLLALRHRARIGAAVERYRTRPDEGVQQVQQAAGAPGSGETVAEGGSAQEDGSTTSAGYVPYRPYCEVCGRDTTTVVGVDDETTEIAYTCICGHAGAFRLLDKNQGKLAWKVDWPMRWAYEGVVFEAGGSDHSTPGSSFTVGSELVREIFGGRPPLYVGYAFVGTSGSSKMSSSTGGAPTPADALRILEVPLLRWLYVRRRPNQAITVAFNQEVNRLYDEWDRLARRDDEGQASALESSVRARSVSTAERRLPETPRVFPFRMLASAVDTTAGDQEQVLRVLRELDQSHPVADLAEVRPRLDRARAWVTEHIPAEERTQVRAVPDAVLLAHLGESERHALKLLLEGLQDHWSLEGLTRLVYGVPKLQQGLPLDAAPTPELKAEQRALFVLLYRLLVTRDTGPRLPTLLLSVGFERVRLLLTPPDRE